MKAERKKAQLMAQRTFSPLEQLMDCLISQNQMVLWCTKDLLHGGKVNNNSVAVLITRWFAKSSMKQAKNTQQKERDLPLCFLPPVHLLMLMSECLLLLYIWCLTLTRTLTSWVPDESCLCYLGNLPLHAFKNFAIDLVQSTARN